MLWARGKYHGWENRWPSETRIIYLDRLQSKDDAYSLLSTVLLKSPRPNNISRLIGVVDEIRLASDDTIASITLLQPMEVSGTGVEYQETEVFPDNILTPLKIHGSELFGASFHLFGDGDLPTDQETEAEPDREANELPFQGRKLY